MQLEYHAKIILIIFLNVSSGCFLLVAVLIAPHSTIWSVGPMFILVHCFCDSVARLDMEDISNTKVKRYLVSWKQD